MEELKREAQGCPKSRSDRGGQAALPKASAVIQMGDGVVPSKASFKSPHSGCWVLVVRTLCSRSDTPPSLEPHGNRRGPPPPLLLSGGRRITPKPSGRAASVRPLQVNHPKFREQDHNKEAGVEEEQAEAIRLAELETLKRDRDQGED